MSRKTAALMLAFASAGIAQQDAPSGLLRGSLVSWAGTPQRGVFTFSVQRKAYLCSFDAKTWFERDNRRASIASIDRGDHLEVVSDRKQGSEACYARTVHVLDMPSMPVSRLRPHPRPATEALHPPGDLTISGVVVHITSGTLTIRSRSGTRQTVNLRPDTRYLEGGQIADLGTLRANTLVFVRAAKNLYNQLEAIQVICGSILQPQE